MNYADARRTVQDFYDLKNPSESDEFRYTEALTYLIEKTKEPEYMYDLGWYYCSKKNFDLERKYMEMAAECGCKPAMEELGYMWYYGQHGEQDYDKAFYYFSKGAESSNGNVNLWCKYKLADMYRYGCSVEKDEDKYREIIEEAYEQVKAPDHLNDPFPEISLRLAGIREEQGKQEEAAGLLKRAKRFMAERLSMEVFWGHVEVMGRIVRYLYKLRPFNQESADFYDLFYLTQMPGQYEFLYKGKKIRIEAAQEDGEIRIRYDGKWYRSFEDFCLKAEIGNSRFTSIYDETGRVEAVNE